MAVKIEGACIKFWLRGGPYQGGSLIERGPNKPFMVIIKSYIVSVRGVLDALPAFCLKGFIDLNSL